jgi:hypothetical protein
VNELFMLDFGGYLIKGGVQILIKKKEKIQKLCFDSDTFIMPYNDNYKANKKSLVIVFTE